MAVRRDQEPLVASDKPGFTECTKWRIIVWGLFLFFALALGVATYLLVARSEENEFEDAFRRTAEISLNSMEDATDNLATLLETFGISIWATAPAGAWPYIRVPNYSQQAKNVMVQTRADVVIFSPLISSPVEWEQYVAQISQEETKNITTYTFRLERGNRVQDYVLTDGYQAPVWQYESINVLQSTKTATNYNLFQTAWIRRLLQLSRQDKEIKISNILTENDRKELVTLGIVPSRPSGHDAWSLLVQPILSTTVNVVEVEVVGFVLSLIPWGPALSAPPGESIVCVLRDDNGGSFVYLVEGSQATFLGNGDKQIKEHAYGSVSGNGLNRMRRELLISKPFTFEVLPTKEFHDSNTSSLPAVCTIIVVLLLLLIAFVFLIFEHCHDLETYEKVRTGEAPVKTSNEKRPPDAVMNVSSPPHSPVGNSKSKRSNARGSMRGSVYTKKEGNKQLLKAFLADQKQSHDLVGLDESGLDDSNTNVDEGQVLRRDNSMGVSSRRSRKSDKENLQELLPSWHETKAIADLFPSASVLFADIAGFTAWSSVREPSKAFSLLEFVYHAFDSLAQRRRVFKVETIGDTYTAVCGLPERRPDHAVALCQFARGCLKRFRRLSHMLEEKLGPETSELALRVGISSGPVMAGIVRQGSTASFQLFGDTHTMASKIEGSGQPGKIHLSKDTATQLKEHGKEHWLEPREDKIMTTKGELQTFWLVDGTEARLRAENFKSPLRTHHSLSSELSDDSMGDICDWDSRLGLPEQALTSSDEEANSKMMRLVAWNCEVMIPLLKMIKSRRAAEDKKKANAEKARKAVAKLEEGIGCDNNVLDEVEEVISLPHYNAQVQRKIKSDPEKVQLGAKVEAELREYVLVIAKMYHSNPFHNFEHASHVTMSTCKLLSRIIAPEEVMESTLGKRKQDVASELHDYTYGITSDPLTQFAVILSALIHDVDHRGVPNNILCKEEKEMAALYDNKSVAEQNSVDLAWEAFLDDRFKSLRKCIYGDDEQELKRFRQLLVNCVMSTDIFDKQLSSLRRARWDKAFSIPDDKANAEDINRKATIVIEHLIQASDVSHTMQHWHIYQKWNEHLFHEMYSAYRLGRSEKDPSEGWYKGEMWFFDNYVIPLAKKLNQCGVFGVSSDEYLTYALANREEWEAKGEEIVANMIEKYSVMMDIETM